MLCDFVSKGSHHAGKNISAEVYAKDVHVKI